MNANDLRVQNLMAQAIVEVFNLELRQAMKVNAQTIEEMAEDMETYTQDFKDAVDTDTIFKLFGEELETSADKVIEVIRQHIVLPLLREKGMLTPTEGKDKGK